MPCPRTRRTPRLLLVGALVAALGLVAAACAPPPPPPPDLPATTVGVTHAVATYQTTFVDTTRPTPALDAFPGAPTRTLPTSVWYPADKQNGPYPLVVFAHGYGVTPATYAALLSRIAQAGYVVVAPTYPILSGQPAGPSDTVGWDDLWPDTWFVTTQVLDASASGSGVLGNLIDPQRIAVAGHSDGGYISFGDGFQPFRLDPRVRAVVSYAASLGYAGSYQPNGRAILHVLSDTDQYNPYDEAVAWDAANLQDPKTVMTLVNATHLAPYSDPNDPHFSTLVEVTIAFLDKYLKGHPEWLYIAGLDVGSKPWIARMN
jgi:dienelactone hydrolase